MSLADEMLNALANEGIEPHIVIGTDRKITVPDELKKIAVQYDHNVETVTFDCPRYWDDNDLSKMIIYINFARSDGFQSMVIAKNVIVDNEDPDVIHFNWTITKEVTEVSGNIKFLVCIKDAPGCHWNSEINTDMFVSPGMECEEHIVEDDDDKITEALETANEAMVLASEAIDMADAVENELTDVSIKLVNIVEGVY